MARLKLAHKGLILVSIPLAFEIAFIAYLTGLLKQVEVQVERETKSRQIVVSANSLMRLMTIAGISGGKANITHKADDRKRFELYSQKLKSEFTSLEEQFQGNRARQANLAQIKQRAMGLLAIIASHLEDTEDAPLEANLLVGARNMVQTEHAVTTIGKLLKKLTINELDIQRTSGFERTRATARVKAALIQGLAANLLVTILLSGYFKHTITSRLRHIIANTERLAKRIPLTSDVSGTDEFAELERELSSASAGLNRLEESKRALMENITTQLNAPLHSIKDTLSTLRSGSLCTLSPKAESRFEQANWSVNRLIRLINDFLDLDKIETGSFDLNFTKLGFAEIAENALAEVRPFSDLVDVSVDADITDVIIECDRKRLERVLINLLFYAVKCSCKGGTVTLKSFVLSDKLNFEVSTRGSVPIANVIDQASGQQQKARQSQPAEGAGVGLRLSICKALVKSHGGSFEIDPGNRPSDESTSMRVRVGIPLNSSKV